jgi:hypothetical protein
MKEKETIASGVTPGECSVDRSVRDLIRKHAIAVEAHTEDQLESAIKQAIEAGDFIRYVHANKQMVVYVPFNEVSRLRLQYNELLMAVENKYEGESRHETALRYIQEAERGSDEVSSANVPHHLSRTAGTQPAQAGKVADGRD